MAGVYSCGDLARSSQCEGGRILECRRILVRGVGRIVTDATRAQHASRLLRTNGFLISTVHYGPGFATFIATRIDEMGVPLRYVIGVADSDLPAGALQTMTQTATHHQASVVIVADDRTDGAPWLSWTDFVGRFGGVIPSLLPLEPGYAERLRTLGNNRRPTELPDGAVDRLYETYVGAGLEFLLGSRVIRYGSERLFQPVPDGVALPLGDRIALLYDAKAADPAFEVSRDDIRRFGDYVKRYNESYQMHAGPVRSFIVVSTEFAQDIPSRQGHSNQLRADVGVPIAFLRSHELAEMISLLAESPWMRTAIRWREIFAPLDVTAASVGAAIRVIQADRVRS